MAGERGSIAYFSLHTPYSILHTVFISLHTSYFSLSPRYPHLVNIGGKKGGAILESRCAYNDEPMPPTSMPTMTSRELWQNALVQIELGTSEASFRTWFRNTDVSGRDGSTVHISLPS